MVTNRRLIDTNSAEFYPTPKWGTKALLKYVKFTGNILEPCCGEGDMAKVLEEEGYSVESSDLYDRGFGKIKNYSDYVNDVSNVVTNPPYNIAENIIEHFMPKVTGKLCVLVRLAFLESKKRYNSFYNINPPSKVLVFSERLSMYPKGYIIKGGGTTSYCWMVWDKNNKEKTELLWIAPGLKTKY